MSTSLNLSTNFMIATLRALTHEIDRVNARLDESDLDDDLSEELGEYVQDLSGAVAVLAEEYENRRKADSDNQNLAQIDGLLNHFATEGIV